MNLLNSFPMIYERVNVDIYTLRSEKGSFVAAPPRIQISRFYNLGSQNDEKGVVNI